MCKLTHSTFSFLLVEAKISLVGGEQRVFIVHSCLTKKLQMPNQMLALILQHLVNSELWVCIYIRLNTFLLLPSIFYLLFFFSPP